MEIIQSYTELRNEIRKELTNSAQSFVRVGYLLRLARDSQILSTSGYADVNEFARAEYGLDPSQVSRFISINERFAEGGCSDRLKTDFQGYGWSKLALMLQLPDNIVREIPESYTREEIKTVVAEVKAEETSPVSDLEVMMEAPEAKDGDLVYMALKEFFHAKTDLFRECVEAGGDKDAIRNALAPMGEATYFSRVPGIGKIMISANASGLTMDAIRTGDKKTCTWQDMDFFDLVDRLQETAKEAWEHIYGEEYPLKEEPKPEPKPEEKPKETPKPEKKPAPKPGKKPEKKPEKKSRVEPEKKPSLNIAPKPEPKPEIAPAQMNEPELSEEELKEIRMLAKLIGENDSKDNIKIWAERILKICEEE